MPMTLVHPAVVLPAAACRPLPTSALVAGSLAPDLPKLLPPLETAVRGAGLADAAQFTHTYPGAATLGALLGAVLLTLFHLLLKQPLLALTPDRLGRKLTAPAVGFRCDSVPRALWTMLALALGAASHVLLDDLTHPDPRLGLHRTLQAGITVVLAAVMVAVAAWWLIRQPTGQPASLPRPLRRAPLWLTLAALPAAVLLWGAVTFDQAYQPTPYLRLHHGVTLALPALAGLVTLYALVWHVLRRTGTPAAKHRAATPQ
ncbi:DUF4184 family protein [Streptomyces eurocidicus]|uniref:DUF4184 domain-containing protein n=1 Tax=Streptomyces eurocidicus TaxID=66423 RepID=A0A7W8F5A2_STREU|nr:DUF4184 family protein [Streptomyces eurocidicus]MBB5122582.1 hypothetical protein [Streptomyces eurocidicus]